MSTGTGEAKGFKKPKWLNHYKPEFQNKFPQAPTDYELQLELAKNTHDQRFWDNETEEFKEGSKQFKRQEIKLYKTSTGILTTTSCSSNFSGPKLRGS